MIGEIAVVGGERISVNVRAQSGLQSGERWNDAAKQRVLRALHRLPLVKHVEIAPQWRTADRVALRIRIAERSPYGIVARPESGALFWIDREGVVLERVEHQPLLPVVSGVDWPPSSQGERIAPRDARGIIREFYALEGRVLARFVELRYRGFDLVLESREGWRALLPPEPEQLSRQVARLEQVIRALKRSGDDSGWRTLDLRFEGEVTVGR